MPVTLMRNGTKTPSGAHTARPSWKLVYASLWHMRLAAALDHSRFSTLIAFTAGRRNSANGRHQCGHEPQVIDRVFTFTAYNKLHDVRLPQATYSNTIRIRSSPTSTTAELGCGFCALQAIIVTVIVRQTKISSLTW